GPGSPPAAPALPRARSLGELHLVLGPIRPDRQVVDHAPHAGALPGVVRDVARLHEVPDLAGQGDDAVVDLDLDARGIDPAVLEEVLEDRFADLAVAHPEFMLRPLVHVVPGPRPAVRRRPPLPLLLGPHHRLLVPPPRTLGLVSL